MEAESGFFFICTKSDCIKLYNDYVMLVQEVKQDIEALHDKTKRIQQAAEKLTKAHPTDMVKTNAWPKLKQAIKHTSNAAKQINQSITIAAQAVNTAETTARDIENTVAGIPQDLLVCGKCKMKKEPTTDNKEQFFGYLKNGKMFRTCMKCRLYNDTYTQHKHVTHVSLISR